MFTISRIILDAGLVHSPALRFRQLVIGLLADEDVSGLAINVETFKGVVQLSGFAKIAEQRQKAERIAASVGGVEDVRNDVALR